MCVCVCVHAHMCMHACMCVCACVYVCVHACIGGLFQHKNKLQNQIMKTRIRILADRCTPPHLFESAFLIDFVPVVRSCGFATSTVFLLFNFVLAKSCRPSSLPPMQDFRNEQVLPILGSSAA